MFKEILMEGGGEILLGRYNEILMEREVLEMQISYSKHFYNAKIYLIKLNELISQLYPKDPINVLANRELAYLCCGWWRIGQAGQV